MRNQILTINNLINILNSLQSYPLNSTVSHIVWCKAPLIILRAESPVQIIILGVITPIHGSIKYSEIGVKINNIIYANNILK